MSLDLPTTLASGDIIGLLIFLAISALGAWLKHRQEQPAEPPSSPRRRETAKAPANRDLTWEEELKRLFDQVAQAKPNEPPPLEAVPPPLPKPAQMVEAEQEGPETRSLAPAFSGLSGLKESVAAYDQASQLDARVEEHLREVTRRPTLDTQVALRPVPEHVRTFRELLSKPQTLRQAMLASFVLAPPKALE